MITTCLCVCVVNGTNSVAFVNVEDSIAIGNTKMSIIILTHSFDFTCVFTGFCQTRLKHYDCQQFISLRLNEQTLNVINKCLTKSDMTFLFIMWLNYEHSLSNIVIKYKFPFHVYIVA